jgi:hypothetical protein
MEFLMKQKSTRDIGKSLEIYIAQTLKEVTEDSSIRITRNSSGGTHNSEIEDINSSEFVISCKNNPAKENINIDYDDWKKMVVALPIGSVRTPLFINGTKTKVFVTLEWDSLLDLLRSRKCKN